MKYTNEFLKENGFPIELDLSEIEDSGLKSRRIISRILMASNFIAINSKRMGPGNYVEISSLSLLGDYYDGRSIAGMTVNENPLLKNRVIVKRIEEHQEEYIIEFLIKNK